MRQTRHAALFVIFLLTLWGVTGCAGQQVVTPGAAPAKSPEEIFDFKIQQLVSELPLNGSSSSGEPAPAAVIPGALSSGMSVNRLELYIADRLAMQLKKTRQFHPLSRQNWFEYREGTPLSFPGRSREEQRLLNSLIVYEVNATAEESLQRGYVSITARDAAGRSVPGIAAETALDFAVGSPARRLYYQKPETIPYPEGLEERPFASLDRLCFSLASELAAAYRAGVTAEGLRAADAEVRVMLDAASDGTVDPARIARIRDALQQAVVKNRGFACAVSREDLAPAFRQADFYQQHKEIFEIEESPFRVGTVLLLCNAGTHPSGDRIGVSLRALWQVSPLETETGELIPTNVAGTYLSGFAAKAYVADGAVGQGDRRLTKRMPLKPAEPARRQAKAQSVSVQASRIIPPIALMDVCFHDFTDVYKRRMRTVLEAGPGVSLVRRKDRLCTDGNCLCYEVMTSASEEMIDDWLRENLRTSRALTFNVVRRGNRLLEVRFHGGFN